MKRLFKNYFSVIFGTGVSRGISFLTTLVIARALGAEGFGKFSIFFTVMMLVWQLPTIIDSVYIRYAKAGKEKNDLEYIRTAFFLKGVIFIALALLSYPTSYFLAHFVFNRPELLNNLNIAIISGAVLSFLSTVGGIYLAQERFNAFSILSAVFYILVFVIIMGIKFLGIELTFFKSMLTYAGSAVIAGGLGIAYLLKFTILPYRVNTRLLKDMIHFGKWLLAVMFIELIIQRMDILVLARVISYEQLGIYSAAVRIGMLASIMTNASSAIFMPKGCASLNSPGHLKAYFKESLMLTSLLSLLIVILIIFTPILIRVFFGEAYMHSVMASRILLLDAVFVVLYTPLGFLFYASGNTRDVFFFFMAKLLIMVIGLFLFIGRFGALGAAMALAVASLCCLFIVAFKSHRLIGLAKNEAIMTKKGICSEV